MKTWSRLDETSVNGGRCWAWINCKGMIVRGMVYLLTWHAVEVGDFYTKLAAYLARVSYLLPVFARGPIYRFLGDGGWWPWKNITGYIY